MYKRTSTGPTPYDAFMAAHALRLASAHANVHGQAVAFGCAGLPGGTGYVQGHTAHHKVARTGGRVVGGVGHTGANVANAAAVRTMQPKRISVQVARTRSVRGNPLAGSHTGYVHSNGNPMLRKVGRYRQIDTLGTVTVIA